MIEKKSLEVMLQRIPQKDYPNCSRIHALKTIGHSGCRAYVKREDELGFGISGSKIRKYRTLIPALHSYKADEVVVIGGAYSNNVLGLVQLLKEESLPFRLFLRETPAQKLCGNALWINLLAEPQCIRYIPRNEWENVDAIANEYKQIGAAKGKRIFVIPEGAFLPESLPGALSLSLDIMRNEEEQNIEFDHIFIDSGTGMMAIGLILGAGYMQKKSAIHVLLLAEDEESFRHRLTSMHAHFETLMERNVALPLDRVVFHRPTTAASFGSVNSKVMDQICHIARNEGFLVDPIYTAKLFLEAANWIRNCCGNALIIHSGGALALSGFQEKLT